MRESRTFSTTEPSITWVAWWVLILGGLLTICAIWLTLTNLNREVILYVLLPGTAIGSLLMILGALGVRVCEELGSSADHQASANLTTQIVLWGAVGTGTGVILGLLAGSLAIGVSVGPLFGVALGMAVWIRTRSGRRIT